MKTKRIIRRLRHQRNHYRQLLSFVMERNHTLEGISERTKRELGERVGHLSYLDSVRDNQDQEIMRLLHVVEDRDVEIEDLRRANALNIAVLLLIAIGAMALSAIYVYVKTC